MMRTVAWAAMVLVCVFPVAGCVESACFAHSDCPEGKVCFGDGKCRTPECTTTTQCGERRVCEGFVCVDGCVDETDCDSGFACSSNRCVPIQQECNCPSAPAFCLKDVNPNSPAVGTDVCLDHFKGNAVVLFYGSIACPHCHGLFIRLEHIKATLRAEGLNPVLLFINLSSVVLDGPTVESLMGFAAEPLLQDKTDANVWAAYGADWYDAVLIDRNGCLVTHVGPLSENDLVDSPGAAFADLWRDASAASCNSQLADVVTVPDLLDEVKLDVRGDLDSWAPDVRDIIETSTPMEVLFDTPDSGELVDLDVPADGDLGSDVGQDVADFVLQAMCQILSAPPIVKGQLVPHFLCQDRNTVSSTVGQGVSDITLKTLVWIAYTGACT